MASDGSNGNNDNGNGDERKSGMARNRMAMGVAMGLGSSSGKTDVTKFLTKLGETGQETMYATWINIVGFKMS